MDNNRPIGLEQNKTRLNEGGIKFDFFQAIYLGFAVFYHRKAWVYSGGADERTALIIFSGFALVYSAIILVYNFKREKRKLARLVCYGALAANITSFVLFIIKTYF